MTIRTFRFTVEAIPNYDGDTLEIVQMGLRGAVKIETYTKPIYLHEDVKEIIIIAFYED